VDAGSGGTYTLEIVDEGTLRPTVEFDAAGLLEALNRDGHVSVYGILFDLNRAILRAGSGKAIDEIARLLTTEASLKIEVQGHTDSTGGAARNRSLSLDRARAVVDALALYGIDRTRLVPRGFGPDKPVGDNATEDGRQQNRRVELVKIQ
jgi:outer membrane protein OmpA-like peptidoglycan-associated protein